MPTITYTANMQRHIDCRPQQVEGGTVREALDAAFAANTKARGYVLDEHGALRRHMVIFVDGEAIRDRDGLSDTVSSDGEIYIMQALAGGG